jgi:hypothetical protein
VDFQRHNHHTHISTGRGFWGEVYPYPSETDLDQKFQKSRDSLTQPWIGQNGPKIQGQNVTLEEMSVSGLARCHKKVDIKNALDNMSQMQDE